MRARIEEFENRLRIGYEIFDVDSGKRTTTGYTIQVAVDENRAIEAVVSYTVSESGLSRRIESWRTVQTGGFAVEEPMTLWQGTTAALPNLEG